jgi:hypothetical protein
MATYFAVYLLTVICLLDLGMCIFYTDSKEHDYPRIGKRKKLEEYLEKGIFGHKYSPPISTVDTLPLREAILPSVMIFQHFDIDSKYFAFFGSQYCFAKCPNEFTINNGGSHDDLYHQHIEAEPRISKKRSEYKYNGV